MLIAIVSDTHLRRGGRRLPDGCVERLRAADLILHGGDFTSLAALEEVEALGAPMVAVHGNVDSDEVRRRVPEARAVEAARARIALLHDAGPARGRLARMRRRFPDAVAVVFGHSARTRLPPARAAAHRSHAAARCFARSPGGPPT